MNSTLKTWNARRMLALMPIALTLILSGCVTTTDTAARVKAACAAWQPVTWSASDSDQTIREAKANNAAWKAYCR